MPTSYSAKKRVRQNAKRNALNTWRRDRIKDQVKAFLAAIAAHDVDEAEGEYRKVCALLDKVATTSTLHRNTAARRKSRLSRKLRELRQAAA